MKLLPLPLPSLSLSINDIIRQEWERNIENLVLDNSILNVFKLCRRKFLYRKILSLVSPKETFALTFGSAFHAALDVYYSAQPLYLLLQTEKEREDLLAKTMLEALEAFAKRATEEVSKLPTLRSLTAEAKAKEEHSLEFGVNHFSRYMMHYPLAQEKFKIMVDEGSGKAMTEVGWALHLPNGIVVGKLDGGIDDGDLLEHKTTSSTLNEDFLALYNVHSQLNLYLAALRELTGKTPSKAVVNVIRVKDFKRDTEKNEIKIFSRVIIRKNDRQLDDTLQQFNNEIGEVKRAIQIGFPAFYQTCPDACTSFFHLCEYHPLCQAQDRDLIHMIMRENYVQREWFPYDIEGLPNDKELVELTGRG
jgi:hypothetical protein